MKDNNIIGKVQKILPWIIVPLVLYFIIKLFLDAICVEDEHGN